MKHLLIVIISCFDVMIVMISCEPTITRCLNDSIEVKWNSTIEHLIGYEIYVQNLSFVSLKSELKIRNKKRSIKLENPVSPFKIENLTSGMSYQIEFEVVLSNASLKEYPPQNFTTKPNKPGNVICNYDGYNINIEWHKPEDYTVFKDYMIIVQGEFLNGSIEVVKTREEYWKTEFTSFHNMTKHKSYNVSIRTVSDHKYSDPAIEKCLTVGAPVNVRVEKLTSHSFDIRWDPPKSDPYIDNYEACIEDYYVTKTISKRGPFVVNFTNEKIKPGQTYEVHVVSVSGYHKSISKIIYVTTPPLPVLNLRARPGNWSNIWVSWNADNQSSQESYKVTYRQVGQDNSKVQVVQHPFINLTGLMSGYNYSIEVVAIFDKVHSESKTLYQPTRPLKPIFDEFVDYSHQSFKIKWKFDRSLSKRDFFKILWTRLDINQTNEIKIYENTNWADIQDFYPGAKYSIQIFALSNGIESEPDSCDFIVRPLPPNDVAVMNRTSSSLFITWNIPKDSLIDFYNVKVLTSKGKIEQDIKPILPNTTSLLIENINNPESYIIKLVSISNNKQSNEIRINQASEIQVSDVQTLNRSEIYPRLMSSENNPNEEILNYNDSNGNSYVLLILSLFIVLVICPGIVFILYKKYCKTPFNKIHQNINMVEFGEMNSPMLDEKQANQDNMTEKIDSSIKIERSDLVIIDKIGSGQFGTVYSGSLSSRNGRIETPVAIKKSKIIGDQSDLENFLQEAITMKIFSHDNVLTLIGVSFESDGSPLVVLPYMERGDLRSYVVNIENNPRVEQLIRFGIDVANGMEYLSAHHFVHRDLAARNCMLDNNLCVKVADFGLARDIYAKNFYQLENWDKALPIKWMAIESIEKGIYDTKTDVWSYGVLMWELLTRGFTPFSYIENIQILTHLKSGQRLEKPDHSPKIVYELLLLCWSFDPRNRPTFAQLAQRLTEILENPFELLKLNNYYNNPVLFSERVLV